MIQCLTEMWGIFSVPLGFARVALGFARVADTIAPSGRYHSNGHTPAFGHPYIEGNGEIPPSHSATLVRGVYKRNFIGVIILLAQVEQNKNNA